MPNKYYLNGFNVSIIPDFIHFQSVAYRARNFLRPKNPKLNSDVVLDGIWVKTESGLDFLLFKNDKIIIFGTFVFFKLICTSQHLFVDGTFSTFPSIFYQLFSFHFLLGNTNFPALFCLLSDKKASTYIELLQIITNIASHHHLDFAPKHVYCDFELAIFRAFCTVFPSIRVHGCYFHYTQSLYRKIQNIGLDNSFKSNTAFHYFAKGLMILPLIPLECLDAAFTVLKSGLCSDDLLFNQFINY